MARQFDKAGTLGYANALLRVFFLRMVEAG